MKTETIRKIAYDKGMTNTTLFEKFVQARFPNESDNIISYVGEWAQRFMSGNPLPYMDKQSKEIYLKLCEEYSGEE